MRRFAAFAIMLLPLGAAAQEIRFVGQSVMFSDYRIIRSLLDSRDLTAFVRAVRAVRLDQPLLKPGAVTVFAPTNSAFGNLPPALEDRLVVHPGHDAVARVLACHIVADPLYAGRKLSDLMAGRESVTMPTLGGCKLTITRQGAGFQLRAPSGTLARISAADIAQSNGIINIIDTVILPEG